MSAPAEPSTAAPIPFVDLTPQHEPIREELLSAIARVAAGQRFILGPEVARFEAALAARLGVAHAIGVSSGTDALLMLLMALGVTAGDEVITTPFSFVATAEVIVRLGARVVFADIRPDTLLIDPRTVEARLGPRTKAILPVHLYGQLCDMPALLDLSARTGVPLLEDCAQSMGAAAPGRAAGAFGLAGAFSFFPTKNLGGWGDGGLISTQDGALDQRLRQIRDHGARARDDYVALGGNFRLDTLQAAILEVKLRHLDEYLAARQEAARVYHRLLTQFLAGLSPARTPIHLPAAGAAEPADRRHVFNLYVIQAERRDALKRALEDQRIQTGVYYAAPLHLQPCFGDLNHRRGDCPVAEDAAARVLALPLFPGITEAQQRRVVEAIAGFYRTPA